MYRRTPLLLVSACLLFPVFPALAQNDDEAKLELSQKVVRFVEAGDAGDAKSLRALGPDAAPALAWLYEMSEEPERVRIANLFYQIGAPSEDAERALLRDAHTANPDLRLAVQYALGRVSSNPEVIDTLLDTLENDRNPLFRDKAACALAYEQIHLTPVQKVRVYQGLIQALSSPQIQVRAVSIQALSILTGQTKGFHPLFPEDRRERSIAMWQKWLDDYRTSL